MWYLNEKMRRSVGEVKALFSAARNSSTEGRRPATIVQLLFLLMLANGTPLLANKILGDRFSRPLDSGARCPDGQPVFGASKTIRGILLSVLMTAIAGRLVGLGCKIGALVGAASMSGDLLSSFIKRRMRLPASCRAVGLDQVPESLFPLLVCRSALSLTASDIAACVLAFFFCEALISRLLYKFRMRDHPY
jgi:CDP-2,3-bis-(O-geranylgeranyl)-sn-glycerol synthase